MNDPETTAAMISFTLKKVEGPVSYILLKPTKKMREMLPHTPPCIVLFGDVHKGNQTCVSCKVEDGCYSFYGINPSIDTFLSSMSDIAQMDVFVEFYRSKERREKGLDSLKKRANIHNYNSALGEFKNFLLPCLSLDKEERKECKVKSYRVHMSDPRQSLQLKHIDSLLGFQFLQLSYESFCANVKEYLPGVAPGKLIVLAVLRLKMGASEFFREVVPNSEIFQMHCKTVKQIRDLPEKLLKLIYKKYPISDAITLSGVQITFPERPYEKAMVFDELPNTIYFEDHTNVSTKKLYDEVQRALRSVIEVTKLHFERINWFGDSALDLYYLGRTFKQPTKGGKPSEISVGYFGNAHVNGLLKFLTATKCYDAFDGAKSSSKCLTAIRNDEMVMEI